MPSGKGRVFFAWSLLLGFLPAVFWCSEARAVVISEFMASNHRTILDEDGDASDWIEIFNEGDSTVNLAGWSLSDTPRDRRKWVFPEIEIRPGEFLLVFASGKDKRNPERELHTNFRLPVEGEYLGLFGPMGEVHSLFAPSFPELQPEISYGLVMETRVAAVLPEGAQARYLIPENNDLGRSWTEADFDDSAWRDGALGIGFDQRSDPKFAPLIVTDVGEEMRRVNASIYIRVPFELKEEDLGLLLQLKMKFADGFVAYINGVEVARDNTRTSISYNARALKTRSSSQALRFSTYRITLDPGVLRAGVNVLAVHGMNNSRTDDDFFVFPLLEGLELLDVPEKKYAYFDNPTPYWPNVGGYAEVAPRPEFSVPSSGHAEPFQLTLTAPEGAQIRYTTDYSRPGPDSTLYTEPITIEKTTMIRARTFMDGVLPSPVAEASYVFLHRSLAEPES